MLNKLDLNGLEGFINNRITSIYSPSSANDIILSNDAGQLLRISHNGLLLIAKGSESIKHTQTGFWIDDETE